MGARPLVSDTSPGETDEGKCGTRNDYQISAERALSALTKASWTDYNVRYIKTCELLANPARRRPNAEEQKHEDEGDTGER